jgi:phosphatidylglycerophosphatase A
LFLFRVFDILKPFPISAAERLPGGLGVMADDVVAGLFTNLLIRGIFWFFLPALSG